ncbi:MAG: CBS domain-containing protein [Leptolyngbyaceae cyanobacterium]
MSFSTLDSLSGAPSAAIIRDPLVVSPETAVLDAIAQMSHLAPRRAPIQVAESPTEPQLHASCALIVDQQQVAGIFTEQDVVSLTAQQQPLKGMTMGQVMTQPVITLRGYLESINQHSFREKAS